MCVANILKLKHPQNKSVCQIFYIKREMEKKANKITKMQNKNTNKNKNTKIWKYVSEQTTDFRLNLTVLFYIVTEKNNKSINLKLIDYT